MPSTSRKQHNFMAAVASNPAFAKKVGVPQSVGQEFTQADKGIKFKGAAKTRPEQQVLNKRKTEQGASEFFKDGGEMKDSKTMMGKAKGMKRGGGMPMVEKDGKKVPAFMAKKMMGGGMAYSSGGYTRAADGVATKGKTKAKQITMRMGGKC